MTTDQVLVKACPVCGRHLESCYHGDTVVCREMPFAESADLLKGWLLELETQLDGVKRDLAACGELPDEKLLVLLKDIVVSYNNSQRSDNRLRHCGYLEALLVQLGEFTIGRSLKLEDVERTFLERLRGLPLVETYEEHVVRVARAYLARRNITL